MIFLCVRRQLSNLSLNINMNWWKRLLGREFLLNEYMKIVVCDSVSSYILFG